MYLNTRDSGVVLEMETTVLEVWVLERVGCLRRDLERRVMLGTLDIPVPVSSYRSSGINIHPRFQAIVGDYRMEMKGWVSTFKVVLLMTMGCPYSSDGGLTLLQPACCLTGGPNLPM